MKCANCDSPALYVYQITLDTHIEYCSKHLPKFLEPLRKAGNLKTTDEFHTLISSMTPSSSDVEVEPKKKRKTKKADENNEGNS